MSLNQEVLDTLSKQGNVKDIYQQTESDNLSVLSVAKVLSAISDDKSLSLFNTIAIMSNPTSDGQQPIGEILISRMNLTRKQYYSRIDRLREAGLISKRNARFILTSLGRIVYETHKTIGIAIHNRWKLEAIDSVGTSLSTAGMPIEVRHKLINALLGDREEIKDILLHKSHVKK
jgi:predicted transcriptional regulator